MHKRWVIRTNGKLHPIYMRTGMHVKKDIENVIEWLDFQNMNSIVNYWVR